MATAAVIAGGAIVGGIAKSKSKKAEARGARRGFNAQIGRAEENVSNSQANQDALTNMRDTMFDRGDRAQQAQMAFLGQGGDAAAMEAANNIQNSPLVQAINARNNEAINAQAAASGMSGGNLLAALQDRNTSTIMQAGFGGLGSIANQSLGSASNFGSLNNQAVGMTNNANTQLGQAQAGREGANAAVKSAGWGAVGDIAGGVTQVASFGMGGGFGANPMPWTGMGGGGSAPSYGNMGGGGTLQAGGGQNYGLNIDPRNMVNGGGGFLQGGNSNSNAFLR